MPILNQAANDSPDDYDAGMWEPFVPRLMGVPEIVEKKLGLYRKLRFPLLPV